MSVLGKIYGNNVTKPEQKGYKTGAKGVLKIESVDRLTSYDILSFVLLLCLFFRCEILFQILDGDKRMLFLFSF